MNFLTRTVLTSILVLSALAVRAQDRRYAVIEYMHIPETQSVESYLATEKLWQRLHQKAVDAGICRAWYLEKVENGGRGDYATIRIYDSLDKMAAPWPDSIRKELYNSEEMKKMDLTGDTRDLIHSELWELEASAIPDVGGDPSTHVFVEFMKSKEGKTEEYYNLEKNTYAKIHKARINAGEMKNWHFMSRVFPGGTDGSFNFATISVHGNKEPVWNTKTVETALGKEQAAKLADPSTVRTLVRTEVWRPVLGTTPLKK